MADLEQAPLTRRELRAREAVARAAAETAAASSIHTSRRARREAEAALVASAELQASVPERPVVTIDTAPASATLPEEPAAALVAQNDELPAEVAEEIPEAVAPFLADNSVLEIEPVASATAVPIVEPAIPTPDASEPVLTAIPVFSTPPAASTRHVRTPNRVAGRPPVATAAPRPSLAKRAISFGTLVGAAAMVVGLSIPASAFFVDTPTALLAVDAPTVVAGQVLDTIETTTESAPVERDGWAMTSEAELRQASTIRRDYSYDVVNEGPVRWPFPVAVPISDGYGARVSPCSGCSSQHKGTDFTPGVGAPITSIADGVVSVKEVSSWGFGNHVFIDHVINGQKVTTVYAHMQEGSSALQVGDVVTAGQFVGLVGATGAATGPHLHLEIRLDGVVQVDPFAWLKANAS
jgi:murein DD-endopeptidase MepM/ murein hydrolase activator NlpD